MTLLFGNMRPEGGNMLRPYLFLLRYSYIIYTGWGPKGIPSREIVYIYMYIYI